MIKGYIFDYGGTLDTGGCHWGKVFWHLYQRLHVPVSEAQFREAYVYAERTLGRHPIIRPYFTFLQTLEAKVRLQMECLHTYDSQFVAANYVPFIVKAAYEQTQAHTAHSRDVLLTLKQDYPLVLVSNFYGNIHTVLQEFGLDTLFCNVIESAVVGIRKPDPRIFSLGVEALAVRPEETVVVGDSMTKDIIPAKQTGCHTVWYQGEQWDDTPIDLTIPDRIIHDLSTILLA